MGILSDYVDRRRENRLFDRTQQLEDDKRTADMFKFIAGSADIPGQYRTAALEQILKMGGGGKKSGAAVPIIQMLLGIDPNERTRQQWESQDEDVAQQFKDAAGQGLVVDPSNLQTSKERIAAGTGMVIPGQDQFMPKDLANQPSGPASLFYSPEQMHEKQLNMLRRQWQAEAEFKRQEAEKERTRQAGVISGTSLPQTAKDVATLESQGVKVDPRLVVGSPINYQTKNVRLKDGTVMPVMVDPRTGVMMDLARRPVDPTTIAEISPSLAGDTVQEQERTTALQRYADQLGKPIEQLTADEKAKAVGEYNQITRPSVDGILGTLTDAIRTLSDPNSDEVANKAASIFITKYTRDKTKKPEDYKPLVDAVLQHPEIYGGLTPTVKTAIASMLSDAGFKEFGVQLSNTAIDKIATTKSAIASLEDLRSQLNANSQYIGPISSLQSYNPWSPAKKILASINRVKQRVGKALEGGVLRKEDEEKYKTILANMQFPGDELDTALDKTNGLLRDLDRDVKIFIESQKKAGRNTGGFESVEEWTRDANGRPIRVTR